MSNFKFLLSDPGFASFAVVAIAAEKEMLCISRALTN